jgi:hypothetical protein
VAELQAQLVMVRAELGICLRKIEKVLDIEEDEFDNETQNSFDLMNRISEKIDKVVETIQQLRTDNQLLQEQLNNCRQSLVYVADRLATLMSVPQIEYDPEDTDQVLLRIQLLLDELFGAGGMKHFVPVTSINELTKIMRAYLEMPASIDPLAYLPVVSERTLLLCRAREHAKSVTKAVKEILDNFEINQETLDPHGVTFLTFREEMFRISSVCSAVPELGIASPIVRAMEQLVGLSCRMLSSMVAGSI